MREFGQLLLALLILWAYLDARSPISANVIRPQALEAKCGSSDIVASFMQMLIIWESDLPNEAQWYIIRATGGWGFVVSIEVMNRVAYQRGVSASPTFLARLASSLLAYDGREYALLEAPLEPYFELAVIRKACALHDSADGLSQDEAARIRALKVGLDELHARQNTAPQSSGEQSPDALSVESNQVADTKP